MNRFRSHWLALFGVAALISLSVSTALGAKPSADANTGLQVSAFVHSVVRDLEEPTEDPVDQPTDTQTDTTDTTDTQSSDHGACVSEVAKGDAVGGDNDNHGGAVSEAAQVTCPQDATTEDTTTEQPDPADTEVEADDAADTTPDAPKQSDGHGHGDSHDGGGDSSDD